MAVHKHAITHHWIRQTLVPFLLYAFASTLPYPADISAQVQRSIDFCLKKSDHPSDGDDLIFERVFMAIMHRHKNLAPDLEMVVDNLEPLAKYLIRRAQLKGPYELLERPDVASAAWVAYEQQRIRELMPEPENVSQESVLSTQSSALHAKVAPSEDVIDPRLVYAQQGTFAAANIPTQLTVGEDGYYRRRNCEFEEYNLRRQQQQTQQRMLPAYNNSPYYDATGRAYENNPFVSGSSQQKQQQHLPTAPRTIQQRAGRQILPKTQRLPQQQYPYPQTAISHKPAQSTSNQPTFTQYATPQAQAAPQQAPQRRPFHDPHDPMRVGSPDSHVPPPQKKFTSSYNTSTSRNGPSGHVQPVLHGPYFPHHSSTDWSSAATQRARELATVITAQERDDLAERIIQRHQTISLQPHSFVGKAKEIVSSPTAPLYGVPPHTEAKGMVHSDRVAISNASITPTYTLRTGLRVERRWHTATSPTKDSTSKGSGLPTLEQVRSRYHVGTAQQQGYHAAPLSSSSVSEGYGGLVSHQAVPGHMQGQQRPMLPAMGGHIDALVQLRHAVLGGTAGLDRTKNDDEEGDAKMSGV